MLRLRQHENDPRNWRPHILVFVNAGRQRALVRLASWFNQRRGVVTACRLVVGDLADADVRVEIKNARTDLDRALAEDNLVAFSEVNMVPEFESGVIGVVQANGIAGLQSNTVMLGWPEREGRLEAQLRIMRAIGRAGKSTLLVRLNWAHEPGRRKRIDLWWGGLENNGDLMLLFAYLLRLNPEWENARLIVHSIVKNEDERRDMAQSLSELIPEARIQAETEIIIRQPGQNVAAILHHHSASADLVFLGLKDPEPGTEAEYAARLKELAGGLRTTIFVRNASEFAGNLI